MEGFAQKGKRSKSCTLDVKWCCFFLSIVNFRFLWLLILAKYGWSDDLTNLTRILSWAVKGQQLLRFLKCPQIKFEPFSQFCHPLYQPSQIWNKTVRQWMVFITEHREEKSPCSPTKQLHLYLQTSRGGTRDAWWAAICQQTNPHLCVATQLPSAAARLLCEKTWAE